MELIYEQQSWSDVRDLYRKWRESNDRRSDDIVQLWETILFDKISKLGAEKHLILEQVLIAALDCGRWEIGEKCLDILQADFPGSLRIQKYKAMLLEALERYDDALDVLDIIIKNDETSSAPRKRKISILKAKGKINDAIKELCEYLKRFMSDQEAWHELSNLYLNEGDFQKSLFCMEELLLHNPHSHLYNQRLAEIRYTMGGSENYEIAKSYFTQSLKLNPSNLRALYGLYLCSGHLINSKTTPLRKKEAHKLSLLVLGKITNMELGLEKHIDTNGLEKAFENFEIKLN